jgi:hypothetical protein
MSTNVFVENGKIIVNGNVGFPATIAWRAAAPLTRGISFSGSGFPHPNQEQAYDVRSKSGKIDATIGEFRIVLDEAPGGYYSGLGSIYVPPHVELEITDYGGKVTKKNVLLFEFVVPFRWISGAPPGHAVGQGLTNEVGRGSFHAWNPEGGAPSQEQILRGRGYPALKML